ncbi:MAG: DMT family transporter [Alphaproteobacteria bacterium]
MRSDNVNAPSTAAVIEALPRRGFAMAMMVIGSITMSFGGLVVRSMDQADAWHINFYRSLAFIIALFVVLLFQYRGAAFGKVARAGWPGWAGGALLAGAQICFLQSLQHTTVANTLFTMSAIPFITALLAWALLKEKLSGATLITMVVAAAGISVMIFEGIGGGSLYGNSMALIAALSFSGFSVLVRRYRSVDMLPAALLSGVIISVIAFFVHVDSLAIPMHDILLCFLWGGAMSGLANTLFIFASRHIVAAELTLFLLLEFSLGPIWVWLFVNEVPTTLTVIGGSLVITAVVVRALFELQQNRPTLKRGRPNPM